VANAREGRRSKAPVAPLTDTTVREAAQGLGEQLKAMFDGVASEPLPDEIIDLVDDLEGRRKGHIGLRPAKIH
jgi:hypothetical protein